MLDDASYVKVKPFLRHRGNCLSWKAGSTCPKYAGLIC